MKMRHLKRIYTALYINLIKATKMAETPYFISVSATFYK